MIAAVASIAGVLGLAVGSFVNVVAHRVPQGQSVVKPRSACPQCGAPIRGSDNIPIVSWLVLGGRCRHCGRPISGRYPVVEAATALLFTATVAVLGIRWVLPAYLWFMATTIALVLTDLDHKRLPNRIVYPGLVVGTVLLGVGAVVDGGVQAFGRALLGSAAYFAALYLLAMVARGGFGMGDVKLASLLGLFTAFVSWQSLFASFFLAFLIGGLVAIILLVARRRGRKDAIPFGPSMIIGAWLAVAFGDQLVSWWLAR